MNIGHTITQLATIQHELDALRQDTPQQQIAAAGLEGIRADLINDLYAAAGQPETLPDALIRFERRQLARRICDELTAIKDAARAPQYKVAIQRAMDVVRVAGEQ